MTASTVRVQLYRDGELIADDPLLAGDDLFAAAARTHLDLAHRWDEDGHTVAVVFVVGSDAIVVDGQDRPQLITEHRTLLGRRRIRRFLRGRWRR